jgi:hypothetical protein
MPRNKPLFPLNPKRDLHLTSPLMHGEDVKQLQNAINLWNGPLHLATVTVDGQFGRTTDHAARVAMWTLGLNDTHVDRFAIRYIFHPWMRSPLQLRRAKARKPVVSPLAVLPTLAAQYIGISEQPPGSNAGYPYPSDWEKNFGMNGVSWCGCFAGSMILKAGGHVTSRVAYTPYIEADARAGQNGFVEWVPNHEQAGPGWLVLYNWIGGSEPEHVGIVESIHPTSVVAIEGNTSGTNPSDGGMVARMTRSYNFVLGYAKPRL